MAKYNYPKTKRMYFKRSYGKKKRLPNVGQTKWYHPKSLYGMAKYAVKGYNLVKGLVNSEIKRFDTVLALTPSSTPGLSLLTGVDGGNDVGQRSGNSILAKYLTVDCDGRINASATATTIRIIIFVDGDNEGNAPTASQLLAVATNTASPINVDYTGRFTILADIKFILSINGDRLAHNKRYIPLHFHQKFTSTTGSSGYGKNSIWAYYISSEPTNIPDVNIYSRLGFYDN